LENEFPVLITARQKTATAILLAIYIFIATALVYGAARVVEHYQLRKLAETNKQPFAHLYRYADKVIACYPDRRECDDVIVARRNKALGYAAEPGAPTNCQVFVGPAPKDAYFPGSYQIYISPDASADDLTSALKVVQAAQTNDPRCKETYQQAAKLIRQHKNYREAAK
jgi:hypothetical protein